MGGVFLRIAPVRVSEGFPTSIFDGMALKTSTIIVLFLCEILTFIVASIQFSQFSLTLLLFLSTPSYLLWYVCRSIARNLVLPLLKGTLLIKELKPILNDSVSSEKLIRLHLL